MIAKKECTKCHRLLVITAFCKDPSCGDGLASRCRECTSADRRERREKLAIKVCPRCEKSLPIAAFSYGGVGKDGLQGWCKECHSDYNRTRRHSLKLEVKLDNKIVPKFIPPEGFMTVPEIAERLKIKKAKVYNIVSLGAFPVKRIEHWGASRIIASVEVVEKYRQKEIIDGKKHCAKCDKWKLVSEFGIDNTTILGLQSWCKECHEEWDRIRWDRIRRLENKSEKVEPSRLPEIKKEEKRLPTLKELKEAHDRAFAIWWEIDWDINKSRAESLHAEGIWLAASRALREARAATVTDPRVKMKAIREKRDAEYAAIRATCRAIVEPLEDACRIKTKPARKVRDIALEEVRRKFGIALDIIKKNMERS